MGSVAGETISHFEILEPLGEGGMGVVSLARDMRLGRLVALKVLHPESCCDPDQKQRFLQEARTASSLNHPNIVTIYEIDSVDGVDLIAMEYVRGRTLDRITAGKPLAVEQTLQYAIQIAQALEAAHGADIIHRDIKPSNIMVNEAGLIKVLDFGLAKIRAGPSVGRAIGSGITTKAGSENSTASSPRTADGVLMGTLAYMSPEQASARPVDARSDIFSFGVVLYEMLSGVNPFQAESNAELVSAILRDEPRSILSRQPGLHDELERIARRCLRKDPGRRFQSATDLRAALQDLEEEAARPSAGEGETAKEPPGRKSRLFSNGLLAAFAAVVVALLGLAWWQMLAPTNAPPASPLVRLTSDPGLTSFPAISPDGSLVAYATDRAGQGQLDIWVQQTSGGTPIRLTDGPTDDYEPAFSPDGATIAYRSEQNGGGIYVIPALGGPSRLIARKGRSPAFSPDGRMIAFMQGSSGVGATFAAGASTLFVVPATGGDPVRLASDFVVAHHPQWSPDSKHVIFVGNKELGPPTYDLWVVPAEGGEPPLRTGVFESMRTRGSTLRPYPFALAGSSVVLSVGAGDSVNLWRVHMDRSTWKPAGPPEQLTHGTGRELEPSLARDGRLVFSSGQQNSDLYELPVDPNKGTVTGELRQLTREAGEDYYPDISRDGSVVAFVSRRSGNEDVFLHDVRNGRQGALLVTPGREMYPKVSADGTAVAFTSIDQGRRSILYMPAAGGVASKLCEDCGLVRDMTPDGGRLLIQMGPPPYVGVMDVATRKVTTLLKHDRFPIYAPKLSPDTNWVAFQVVDKPTSRTIYVARMSSPNEWIPVTDGTAMDRSPYWSPDGKLLYYLSERDSFRCIWAQRLDSSTRRPIGGPFVVAHFHDAVRSMMNLEGPAQVSVTVGPDRLVFSMGTTTANVWLARLP